jgi:hypothetical protein
MECRKDGTLIRSVQNTSDLEARSVFMVQRQLSQGLQAFCPSVTSGCSIFLPEDPADIPFWSGTQDDLVFVGVLIGIEDELAIEVPDEFWASLPQINFGDAVRALVERNKARPVTRDHAE